MSSLLLDVNSWDLTVNNDGNIATTTSDGYATAQDVACACRLFLGELWYDTTQGVPYFGNILGKLPAYGFIASKLQLAAFSVIGVTTAVAQVSLNSDRVLTGTVSISSIQGSFQVGGILSSGIPWYVQSVVLDDFLLTDQGKLIVDQNGNPILG